VGIFLDSLGIAGTTPSPYVTQHKQILVGDRSAAKSVTADTALSLVTIYRAVAMLAGMCASMELSVTRNGHLVDPLPAIVSQPDPWRDLADWVARVVTNLALDGNAYLLKHFDARGTLIALEVLNPFAVTPRRDKHGRKVYDYRSANGKVTTYTGDRVHHIWSLQVPGHEKGLGPIQAARLGLAGHLDARDYGSEFFNRNDVPSGVLSTDQALNADDAKQYRSMWAEAESHGVRVVGKGLSYERIMLAPEDAQWIESQQFGVTDCARLMGLPAAYALAAVEGSAMTYTNMEQVDTLFVNTTLRPLYLRPIESALTSLSPARQRVRFITGGIFQPDAKTRAEIEHLDIAAGILHADERRMREYGPRKDVA